MSEKKPGDIEKEPEEVEIWRHNVETYFEISYIHNVINNQIIIDVEVAPKQMVIIALIIAQLGVTLGVWGSIWFDIQTGLAIVLVLAILFFIALIISKLIGLKSGTKSLMAKFWSPRH